VKVVSLIFVLLAFVIVTPAQSPVNPPPSGEYPAHVPSSENERDWYSEMVKRSQNPSSRQALAKEDRVLKKGLLAPTAQDRTDNQDLLNQKDTGLIRLLPREVYDWRTYHTAKKLDMIGGGSYYSFLFLTHAFSEISDLQLDRNSLSVGFVGFEYGFMADLGDTTLESASQHSVALFMSSYEPPRTEPEAHCERLRFRKGVAVEQSLLKSTLPVRLNATYLLRSIHYGAPDALIAFRISRQDTDGSLIIPWKLLRVFSPRALDNRFVVRVNPTTKCSPD